MRTRAVATYSIKLFVKKDIETLDVFGLGIPQEQQCVVSYMYFLMETLRYNS